KAEGRRGDRNSRSLVIGERTSRAMECVLLDPEGSVFGGGRYEDPSRLLARLTAVWSVDAASVGSGGAGPGPGSHSRRHGHHWPAMEHRAVLRRREQDAGGDGGGHRPPPRWHEGEGQRRGCVA